MKIHYKPYYNISDYLGIFLTGNKVPPIIHKIVVPKNKDKPSKYCYYENGNDLITRKLTPEQLPLILKELENLS